MNTLLCFVVMLEMESHELSTSLSWILFAVVLLKCFINWIVSGCWSYNLIIFGSLLMRRQYNSVMELSYRTAKVLVFNLIDREKKI